MLDRRQLLQALGKGALGLGAAGMTGGGKTTFSLGSGASFSVTFITSAGEVTPAKTFFHPS